MGKVQKNLLRQRFGATSA